MGMRETAGSMRAYFLIAGALSALSALWEITHLTRRMLPIVWKLELAAFSIAALALGVAFIVAGLQLTRALPTGAAWIKRLLVVTGCVSIARLLVAVGVLVTTNDAARNAAQWGLVFGAVIGVAIAAYLYANLLRLSAAAQLGKPLPAASVR
jgi:hypothetical protein